MQNKFLRGAYIIAIVLIACVFFLSYLFVTTAINSKDDNVAVIRLARKQIVYSQIELKLSLDYKKEIRNKDSISLLLTNNLHAWQDAVATLETKKKLHKGILDTKTIDSLYSEMQSQYSVLRNSIQNDILQKRLSENSIYSTLNSQLNYSNTIGLFIAALQEQREAHFKHIKQKALYIFIVGIGLLICEVVFVFMPILKRNKQLLTETSDKNKQLSEQNELLQLIIQKQNEAKRELEESETKFRLIAENTSDGIFIYENGAITYSSATNQKILGYDFEETKGRTLDGIFKLVHPEDVEKIREIVTKAFQERQAFETYEYRALHKLGYYIWKEDTLNNLYDEDGNLTKTIVIARNITKRKEFEKARIEREQLLSSVFDTVSDAIFVLENYERSNEYLLSFVNNTFQLLTGISISSTQKTILKEILPEDLFVKAEKKIKEAIETEEVIKWQEKISFSNADFFVGEIFLTPIFDDKGICVRLIGVIHNITEQEKAVDALNRSHNRLLKLTAKVSAAIYEFEMTYDGKLRFPFISQFIRALFPHISLEELSIDATKAFESIHTDDIDSFYSSIEISKNNLTEWKLEYRVLMPDGTIKWLKSIAHPEKKEHDNAVVWYGYLEDITQSKEEEKRLRLFESAISNSTEGIVISEVDLEHNGYEDIIFANDAFVKMTGYKKNELNYNLPNLLRGPETDPNEIVKLVDSLKKGQACEIEIVNYRKSGEAFWVNIAIAPVFDNNQNITHWIAIQRDVTERKLHIQSIQAQNEKLKEIAWVQSHVVRAPLARLMGLIDLLEGSLEKGTVSVNPLINHINESATELDKVVRDIVNKTEEAIEEKKIVKNQ